VVVVASCVGVVFPHSCANTVTLSPDAPLETEPASVVERPNATRRAAPEIATVSLTTTVPRSFWLNESR
jgi:hypothetical protein